MKMFRKDEGFTLVELMVVVLIIGILVAIAIPVFNAAKANAERKSCWGNQRTLEGLIQAYNAEEGNFPAAVASLTAGAQPYLQTAPNCPDDDSFYYGSTYEWNAVTGIVLDCTDGASAGAGAAVHGHF
jgi:type IV pilus assembly protein PilA